MERDTPPTDRPSPGVLRPKVGVDAQPAAVDRNTATTLASSLRRRPGHVVVTAPFATTAARLFAMAESQLGSARIVRLSARLLLESELARLMVGVTQRGLPPPSAPAVAAVIDEARRKKDTIVVLVEDADSAQLDRLERLVTMIDRTPGMREVVRLVLLGSSQLRRMLQTPPARAFVDSLALNLDVSSPETVTIAPAKGRTEPAARRQGRPTRRRLKNEKLLVLAVGAVLVVGVLLFPIEPTVYPERAVAPRATDPGPAAADVGEAATIPAASEATAVDEVPEAVLVPTPDELAAATGEGTENEDAARADVNAAGADAVEPGAPVPKAPVETTAAEAAAPASETPRPDAAAPAPAAKPAARAFRPPARPGPAFQLGAFRDRENAVRLAERLVGDFDGVYIDRLGQGDASLHRVRIPITGSVLGEAGLSRALAARGFDPIRVD